jgi:type VI secretion system protein ImpM
MSAAAESPVLWFGKLPSRGDFVRSAHGPTLIQVLDRWLSGGMELMASDARWKTLYDRAQPVRFTFLGSRHSRGLVGVLMASQDSSGRRFPFIAASTFECGQPLQFFARAPLALSRPWARLERKAFQLHQAADATPLLAEMGESTVAIESDPQAYAAGFEDFCEMQTVGSLQAMLSACGHTLHVRHLVLSLGLLLQPVLTSGEHLLERGLLLPLPADPMMRPLVAAFWLEMVSGFLDRAAFELALFQQPGAQGEPPMLALGFEGNSPRSLYALLDPALNAEVYLDTREADWVEDSMGEDYAVHKLSSYLQQDGLSLQQALSTFKEVFLGN